MRCVSERRRRVSTVLDLPEGSLQVTSMDAATDAQQSRYYHFQGLRLHFTDWGNAQAPPLRLVHGGLDHSRSWDHLARALRRDFHVVAPDLRGHGVRS
jgi:alpha-beta hydrolase superfamily lysophospholipase